METSERKFILLTLNRYISSELDLFGNNKELRFRTYGLMLNHVAVLRHKGQEGSFMDLGGKSPSMETGSSKCGAFSLAELWWSPIDWAVTGQGEIYSSCWGSTVESRGPARDAGYLSSVRVSSVRWVSPAWEFPLLASRLHFKWGFYLLISPSLDLLIKWRLLFQVVMNKMRMGKHVKTGQDLALGPRGRLFLSPNCPASSARLVSFWH